MTHIPHTLSRTASPSAAKPGKGSSRDVLWGRPVFKAPQLNVRVPFEPLPFTATRVTQVPRTRAVGVA